MLEVWRTILLLMASGAMDLAVTQEYPHNPSYPNTGFPNAGHLNPGHPNNTDAHCPNLPEMKHATTFVCTTVMEPVCQKGYDSTGPRLFCTARERQECSHSESPSIALALGNRDMQTENMYIQYFCEGGYESQDMPNLHCQANGTWDYDITNLPVCVDINECLYSPCDPTTYQCFNTAGSYECRCNPCGENAKRTVPKQETATTGYGQNCQCSCDEGYVGDPSTSCSRPECLVNNDCDKDLACGWDYSCYDPCPGTCGSNTTCDVEDHRPVCSCLPTYVGNPYGPSCGLEQEYRDPCDVSPCGPGAAPLRVVGFILPNSENSGLEWGGTCQCNCPYTSSNTTAPGESCSPECAVDSDCPSHLACTQGQCIDPCDGSQGLGICGYHAECNVRHHSPICSCPQGYEGNALVECKYDYETRVPEEDQTAPCNITELTDCELISECLQSSQGYIGELSTNCTKPQCLVNADCGITLACGNNYICYDPCSKTCADNATCQVEGHRPMCTCLQNYVGDPYTTCALEEKYSDPCDPNPCGKGATPARYAGLGHSVCKCLCPYTQDSLLDQGLPCRPECVVQSDCPPHKACNDNKCLNPCYQDVYLPDGNYYVEGFCPTNTECSVINHSPICFLPEVIHAKQVPREECRQIPRQECHPDDQEESGEVCTTIYEDVCSSTYETYFEVCNSQGKCRGVSAPDRTPPRPAYAPPRPAYAPPRPAYAPPSPAYAPPSPAYAPPSPAYAPPSPAYAAPILAHGPWSPAHASPSIVRSSEKPPINTQRLEGCKLEWEDDAEEKVTFTNKDDEDGGVLATLWVEPSAFKCGLTLTDIAQLDFEMKQSETFQSDDEDSNNKLNSTGVEPALGVRPKSREELATLNQTAHNGGTVSLKRWRAYTISVTASWKAKEATKKFIHDTFQWRCQDDNETTISQKQFCDGIFDCPNDKDEEETVCKASELSKRLSIVLSYPVMFAIILGYFMLPKLQASSKVVKKIKADLAMEKTDKGEAARKNNFISSYKAAHSSPSEMTLKVEEVKFEFSCLPSLDQQTELCRWVQEVEEDLHPDPGERYQCVLGQYRASHPLAGRIADPPGGIMLKVGSRINSTIVWMFLLLCLHIFDYVKDIDISTVIYHFDTVVLQQAYQQYNDFNFFYLFLTSVGLLTVTHVFNVIYWVLARTREETKVLRNQYDKTWLGRALYLHLPLVPALLPILTFCRLAELSLALDTQVEQDQWVEMAQEKVLLERMANDIKMIESVNEVFGQLVIQSLLLIKFTWLLKGDDVKLKFLGISFRTYMVITMIISFLSMLPAVLKYHKRNRENLRPMTSIATIIILLVWIGVIFTKVSVYVLGFQNTPGLLFVPIIIHMAISFAILTRLEPQFGRLQPHDQLVYVLVSSLVPVSIPCQQSKDMRKGYGLSLLLFAIENITILIFAMVMNNFSNNSGYRKSFKQFPELIKIDHIIDDFDHLCAWMMLLVLAVTTVSAALLVLYSKYHPSNKLFKGQKAKSEEPQAEKMKEATAPKWTNVEFGVEMSEKEK